MDTGIIVTKKASLYPSNTQEQKTHAGNQKHYKAICESPSA